MTKMKGYTWKHTLNYALRTVKEWLGLCHSTMHVTRPSCKVKAQTIQNQAQQVIARLAMHPTDKNIVLKSIPQPWIKLIHWIHVPNPATLLERAWTDPATFTLSYIKRIYSLRAQMDAKRQQRWLETRSWSGRARKEWENGPELMCLSGQHWWDYAIARHEILIQNTHTVLKSKGWRHYMTSNDAARETYALERQSLLRKHSLLQRVRMFQNFVRGLKTRARVMSKTQQLVQLKKVMNQPHVTRHTRAKLLYTTYLKANIKKYYKSLV